MKKLMIVTVAGLLVIADVAAQGKQEREVSRVVEELGQAILNADSTVLMKLTDEDLVYGHSSGKMENRREFVSSLVSGSADFKTLEMSNQSVTVKGNTAVVRHRLRGNITDNGNDANVNLGIIMVWHSTKKGGWKLLARQAFKL